MAFITAYMAHAPDADPEKSRALVETPMLRLFAVLVRDQEQALGVARALVKDEGVQSILLCPGFTNRDVAGVQEAAGDSVIVSVARPDGPGSQAAREIIAREWGRG